MKEILESVKEASISIHKEKLENLGTDKVFLVSLKKKILSSELKI
jgi:hypothetical protein